MEKERNVKEILDLVTAPSKEDVKLITDAFEFAKDAHEGQNRYSGEPYFYHLIETAKNLAAFGMTPKMIVAGLLHDTIEDGKATEKEVKEKFGEEILFLVQGVTKLGEIRFRGLSRHTESLRKLFVAMAQDIRVLIIKLTDRLHNMQTLDHVPKEKQKRIAMETLEIYAPLAYRLGIRKLNKQLEDLAFKYVYPEKYEETKQLLKQKKKETEKNLEKMSRSIKKEFAKVGFLDAKVDFRIKGLYSLHKKLERKNKDIEKIYDIAALRVVVKDISDCYKALGIIHNAWRPLPGRIKDYIAFPKPNGYQSLHTTIFTGDGSIVEVQIRTEEMHKEAEYGIASHLSYKEGSSQRENQNLLWIRSLLPSYIYPIKNNQKISENQDSTSVPEWLKDLTETQSDVYGDEFLENLKMDFFGQRIFVFTPIGDVVDLPIDSSPVDFAYMIHSDIGDHIYGAKVNGKMASLDSKLKNGDIVEIQTKKNSKPNKKWLDFVKTTMAKRHIRAALNKESGHQQENEKKKKKGSLKNK